MNTNEREQFRIMALLSLIFVICIVGVGVLIILENVTQQNSFGIDGIIATLKDASMLALGALAAMTRQGPVSTSTTATTMTATVPPAAP